MNEHKKSTEPKYYVAALDTALNVYDVKEIRKKSSFANQTKPYALMSLREFAGLLSIEKDQEIVSDLAPFMKRVTNKQDSLVLFSIDKPDRVIATHKDEFSRYASLRRFLKQSF
jgi:hypothetical protein